MADNGCVSYAEFSSVWTAIYHDSLDVATKFVTNMDMDHDGCLDDIEVLVNGVRNNQHLKIGSYMTSHPNAFLLVWFNAIYRYAFYERRSPGGLPKWQKPGKKDQEWIRKKITRLKPCMKKAFVIHGLCWNKQLLCMWKKQVSKFFDFFLFSA